MQPANGRNRVVIEGLAPELDSGRYPIKRIVGESVVIEADVFADGHYALLCVLLHRREGDAAWIEAAMEPLVNDRWQGTFTVPETVPAHIFVIRRRMRAEREFDYYM